MSVESFFDLDMESLRKTKEYQEELKKIRKGVYNIFKGFIEES